MEDKAEATSVVKGSSGEEKQSEQNDGWDETNASFYSVYDGTSVVFCLNQSFFELRCLW